MQYMPIDKFSDVSGIGRTKIYYLLGEGKLRAIKVGKRTLIDAEAATAWLASQPAAEIRCHRRAA